MKHIAIIGIPDSWSSEFLKRTIEDKGIAVDLFKVNDLVFHIQLNKVFYGDKDLESYDAIIIKKLGQYHPRILDWLDILGNLEDKGLRFYSSPKKLRNMISRIGCTKGLAAGEIPMPPTLITENIEEAQAWIDEREGAVFKPNFSTKARGMEILKPGEAHGEKLQQLMEQFGLLYLQELMELPGQDFGVVFTGDKYLGTYARVSGDNTWNTTTADGGHYASYDPDENILEIARKAKDLFGLDFCCVDVAVTPIGPIVFEVSAFGGFKGLYQGANINAAEELINHILKQ